MRPTIAPCLLNQGRKIPRRDYWVDSLEDSGIVGLEQLQVGYSLVALSALTDPTHLRIILRKSLAKMTDWNLDTLPSLPAGYVLQHYNEWIEPGCCCDLSNLGAWSDAATYTGEMWSMVWIGHPWTHVRAKGDLLYFAEPSEASPTDIPSLRDAVSLSRQDLLKAIEGARLKRQAFADRLLPLIEELKPPVPADKLLEILLMGQHGATR